MCPGRPPTLVRVTTTDTAALREVVAVPDFRRLLRVRLVGQFGDGLFQAALFSAVFFNPERATSAGQAASSFAVLLLPYSLVGPFAGVFLDRWRRQRVLLNSNLGRAGLVTVFAGLLAVLGATALPVQALALVVISLNRFVLSGLSAALPHVVDPPRLVVANSLSGTLGGGAFILGGGAAVGLRAVFGEGDLGASRSAVAAAAVYLVAALLTRALHRDLLGPAARPTDSWLRAAQGVVRGVRQGAAHVRERGPAARGLAAISAHRFFYGLSFVATLLLYTETGAIGRGVTGLAEVVVASGLGGLLAALVTPARHPHPRHAALGGDRVRRRLGRRGRLRVPVHARRLPRRGRLPRLRRPGQQDLRRHAAAGERAGRLPRPGLLLLRHDVQRQLRLGGRGGGRAAAGRRQELPGHRLHRRRVRA